LHAAPWSDDGRSVADVGRSGDRDDPKPLEDTDEDTGLRLDALDGRDHEHGDVEHGEGSLDLGDEVRVAGSEPFGQCGLTGFDMGDDPEVE